MSKKAYPLRVGEDILEALRRWSEDELRSVRRLNTGGETVDHVYQRVSEIIDEIASEHAGGRVIVVSHGLAIYHAFAHICGLGSPSRGHRVFALVDNCSISRATYRGSYWYLSTLNEYAHLSDG